jgi:hypothetical protein
VSDEPKPEVLPAVPPRGDVVHADEPPVVARMVIEIRSDGSRTIARGALEDVSTGQRAAIEAQGTSPIQLAFALARSLGQLPRLTARSALRGLLGGRKK